MPIRPVKPGWKSTESMAPLAAALIPWLLKLSDLQSVVVGVVLCFYIYSRTQVKAEDLRGSAKVAVAETQPAAPAAGQTVNVQVDGDNAIKPVRPAVSRPGLGG